MPFLFPFRFEYRLNRNCRIVGDEIMRFTRNVIASDGGSKTYGFSIIDYMPFIWGNWGVYSMATPTSTEMRNDFVSQTYIKDTILQGCRD